VVKIGGSDRSSGVLNAVESELSQVQHGWGYHRLTMTSTFITFTPLGSQEGVPLTISLSFTFDKALDFTNRCERGNLNLLRFWPDIID